ncbi:hypothetical protein ACEWY4_001576 [Coilia grayii]|uniref:Integrase catalytic domain-containing protein n=1 Tax=Coilia grayii TaxID=363190 RepID=A0ABD1KUH3_9TELE
MVKVVQTQEVEQLLTEFHTSHLGGHCGVEKTLDALNNRYYWPGMSVDVKNWVSEPWEIVGMDLVGKVHKTKDGYEYICVLVDYFTKWSEAFPLRGKTAEEVSRCIVNLFYKFGAPMRILTDNGREFVNQIDDSIENLLEEEVIYNSVNRQDKIFAIVRANIGKSQQKVQKRKQEQGTPMHIEVGDRVLRQNIRSQQRKGGKLDPDFLGPFTVTQVEGKSVDLIDDKGKTYKKINLDHLVHYQQPPTKFRKLQPTTVDSPGTTTAPNLTTTAVSPGTTTALNLTTTAVSPGTTTAPNLTSTRCWLLMYDINAVSPGTTTALNLTTTAVSPGTTTALNHTTTAVSPGTTTALNLTTTAVSPGTTTALNLTTTAKSPGTTATLNLTTTADGPVTTAAKSECPELLLEASPGSPAAGRTGRVSKGYCYRLVTRDFWEREIPDFVEPEMLRAPLDSILLKVKLLDMGDPHALLSTALSPPNLSDIERTVLNLKAMGALSVHNPSQNCYDGEMTFLGCVLAHLPVSLHLGKMIVLGHVFRVLDDCLIIAACLSLKSFFNAPYLQPLAGYRSKLAFANSVPSDHIACLNAFKEWLSQKTKGEFRHTKVAELYEDLKKRVAQFNMRTGHSPDSLDYTNLHIQKFILQIRNMPPYAFLYYKQVQSLFQQCGQVKSITFDCSRAYVEFCRSATQGALALQEVSLALLLAQKKQGINLAIHSNDEVEAHASERVLITHLRNPRVSVDCLNHTASPVDFTSIMDPEKLPAKRVYIVNVTKVCVE